MSTCKFWTSGFCAVICVITLLYVSSYGLLRGMGGLLVTESVGVVYTVQPIALGFTAKPWAVTKFCEFLWLVYRPAVYIEERYIRGCSMGITSEPSIEWWE